VPQRQPADGFGYDTGHRVRRRRRPVRAVQHYGGRGRRGHVTTWHPGTEGGRHADRRQRAAIGPSGCPELTDRRGLQEKFVVETSTVHQTRSSGIQ